MPVLRFTYLITTTALLLNWRAYRASKQASQSARTGYSASKDDLLRLPSALACRAPLLGVRVRYLPGPALGWPARHQILSL